MLLFFYTCTLKNVKQAQTAAATISFVGDLMCYPSMHRVFHTKNSYDFRPLFVNVKSNLICSDLTIGNLETVVSTNAPLSGYPRFNAPREYLVALTNAGFDLLSLANNHIYDLGPAGLLDTMAILTEYQLNYTGVSQNSNSYTRIFYTNIKSIKFAFIAYSYGFNRRINNKFANAAVFHEDKQKLAPVVKDVNKALSKHSDFIILITHWGKEYQTETNPQIIKNALYLLEQGIDIIIGMHPHMLQPVCIYHNVKGYKKLAAYSLGNFVSAQKRDKRLKTGMILNLTFVKKNNTKSFFIKNRIKTRIQITSDPCTYKINTRQLK